MSRALESSFFSAAQGPCEEVPSRPEHAPTFSEVYDSCARSVWRTLRRLGVGDTELDDAMQDVFLVVHRKLKDLRPDVPPVCWVYGIALRVARSHRRSAQRRDPKRHGLEPVRELDGIADVHANNPEDAAQREAAGRLIRAVLEELDDPKREVFVLAEFEQMTAPQIAQILELPLNTVYSRLRAARRDFEIVLSRKSESSSGRML